LASRFRFRGSAFAAAGRIGRPFSEIIEVQAASTIAKFGGHAAAHSADFRHRDLVRFHLAHTAVTGSSHATNGDDKKLTFSTRIAAIIEGLNIHDIVTADRVVAMLVSTYTPESDGEPSVHLIGSHFENLRVAGIPIDVDLAIDVFDKHHTHRALAGAYQNDPSARELIDKLSLSHRAKEAPPHILRWFNPSSGSRELPATRGITATSLVRGMTPAKPGLDCWGHVIHIPGFGTVRLAEVEISKTTRNLTMIQVNMGSPCEAELAFCDVIDGGDDY
jgi:hypothetical protein